MGATSSSACELARPLFAVRLGLLTLTILIFSCAGNGFAKEPKNSSAAKSYGQLETLLGAIGAELKGGADIKNRVVALNSTTPEDRLKEWLRGINHIIIFNAEGSIKSVVILKDPPATPKTAAKRWTQQEKISVLTRKIIERIFKPGTKVTVSSDFGNRKDPFTGKPQHHNGLDLAVTAGTEIHAPWSGTISESGFSPRLGRYLVLRHEHGLETLYAHLSNSAKNVVAGSSLSIGEVLGAVGNSGQTTGVHLHFEVRRHSQPYNPDSPSFWLGLTQISKTQWFEGGLEFLKSVAKRQ